MLFRHLPLAASIDEALTTFHDEHPSARTVRVVGQRGPDGWVRTSVAYEQDDEPEGGE